MKKILVPTDASECAQRAAQVAIQLAAKANASIHFLSIMPDTDTEFHVPQTTGTLVHNTQKVQIQNEINRLVSLAAQSGVEAFPLLVLDKSGEYIENYVDPLGIDLIIMGSHGATGIREFFIGSNTQRVVRKATVPVLVIKEAIDKFEVKNILFASPFEGQSQQALNWVVQFAKLFGAVINIAFVNFPNELGSLKLRESLMKQIQENNPGQRFRFDNIEGNDLERELHELATPIGADLIALTIQAKTGFILPHSVAEDMVNHEKLPVLVINT